MLFSLPIESTIILKGGTDIVRKQNIRCAIESVYKRLGTFGKPGPTCEMQVRYSLIDPILRAIGWNLEEPDCVLVELNPGDGTRKRRDYTFLVNGKQVAIVESKCWGYLHTAYGEACTENIPGYRQLYNYCRRNRIKIGALSDGGCWVILEFHPNRKVRRKVVLDYNGNKTGLGHDKTVRTMVKEFRKLTPTRIAKLYE